MRTCASRGSLLNCFSAVAEISILYPAIQSQFRQKLAERPAFFLPDLPQVLDVFHFFELVKKSLFDEAVHLETAAGADLFDGFLESRINARRELDLDHDGFSLLA